MVTLYFHHRWVEAALSNFYTVSKRGDSMILWSMKGGNTVGGAERRRTEQRRAERFSIGQWFPSTGPFHIIGDAMVVDNIAILRLWWFLTSPWPINIGVRRNGRNLHVPQVTVSPEVGEPC